MIAGMAATTTTHPTGLTINTLKKVVTQPGSNKRPSVVVASETNKRARPSSTAISFIPSTITHTTTPQLLQQLITPAQTIQIDGLRGKSDSSDTVGGGKWSATSNGSTTLPQSSNSVLMNLLVSGCDVSAGYTCFPRPTKAAKA